MFEFLFKYSSAIFNRGTFLFASGWPFWALIASIIAASAALGFFIWQKADGRTIFKSVMVWVLQSGLAALLLFMLWHPALSVATLRPQQNIVAVVVDDSRSMAQADEGSSTRKDKAVSVLNSEIGRAHV